MYWRCLPVIVLLLLLVRSCIMSQSSSSVSIETSSRGRANPGSTAVEPSERGTSIHIRDSGAC